MYTREQIETAVKAKGYVWFEDANNKGYDVNIVGIRNNETKGRVTNAFDDCITISYKVDGEWQFHCYKCTTDPGTHWVENIMRKEGVAVLKPGQYRGSHKIRLHAGKYPALGQQRDVTVYRDNNKDGKYDLDENNTQTGLFGINIHRATARPGRTSNLRVLLVRFKILKIYESQSKSVYSLDLIPLSIILEWKYLSYID